MTRGAFYAECFRRSHSGPWGWAQGAGFLATIVFGIVAWQFPKVAEFTNHLIWIVPLVVGIVTFAVTWTLAPYTMYRELENSHGGAAGRCDALEAEIRSARQEMAGIESRLAAAKTADESSHRVEVGRNQFLAHAERGHEVRSTRDMRSWMQAAQELVDGITNNMRHMLHVGFPSGADEELVSAQNRGSVERSIASLRVIATCLTIKNLAVH